MNKRKQKLIAALCALTITGASNVSALSYLDNNVSKQEYTNNAKSTYSMNAKASKQSMKTTSSLNVRSGPSTKYKTLGKLKKGTTITVTSTTGSWAKFTYNGKTAYVSTKYLKKVSSTVNTSKQKMKTTSSLNVRSGPSTKYEILGKLKKGATITVTSTTGSWAKFTYNGKTAYASTKYLKKVTSSNNTNNENTKYPVAKNVTSSKIGVRKFKNDAYIRESTTKGSKIIGIGKKGNMIEYVKLVKTGLHKVIFNGKYAYIEDYDKKIDVFEVSGFGNLNSNTTNKYVKKFDNLADKILEKDGWFWSYEGQLSSKYGLVEFGTPYGETNLDNISIYTGDVTKEERKIRDKACLEVLTTVFGEKNAKDILDIVLKQEYVYLRKTYNGVTIDINVNSSEMTFIEF